MQTAPVSPPPRPPRDGNVITGSHDWHDNSNAGRRAKWFRYGLMVLKCAVLILFAAGIGELAVVLFRVLRLQYT